MSGRDLAGMLTNELAGTGKFKMVERAKLDAVLEEQDLADSGRVNKKSGAKIGKLTGAKYLVIATVSVVRRERLGRRRRPQLPRHQRRRQEGRCLHGRRPPRRRHHHRRDRVHPHASKRAPPATASAVGVYRGGFGGNLGKYEKTPTGKAIRAVIIEISEYLSCAMVDKGDCMAEYEAKEAARREKTKKSIKLD